MTRGQITIITKDGIMTSIEFNGDMYMPTKKWAGHGRKVINALKRVNDIASYQYEVAKFNKENHHYNDTTLTYKVSGHNTLDFTKDYFDNWFSDYVYIKNLVAEVIKLKTKLYDKDGNDIGEKDVELAPNQIAVLYFGELKLIA
jgi:hypothetical protein